MAGWSFWTVLEKAIGARPDGEPPASISRVAVEAYFASCDEWKHGPLLPNWADVVLEPGGPVEEFCWHIRVDANTVHVSRRYRPGQVVRPAKPVLRDRTAAAMAVSLGDRMQVIEQLADGWIRVKEALLGSYPWPSGLEMELHPEDVRPE